MTIPIAHRALRSVLLASSVLTLACGRSGPEADSAAAADRPAQAAPLQPASTADGHLQVRGAAFASSAGVFEWRGITAFRLAEMVSGGREQEAVAFLDFARADGLTVVRVLAMAAHLFELTPEAGLRAMPRLLELARARGLHVEIVALADTRTIDVDLEEHVKAVGAVAARHTNALVEIANEPWHPTQDRRLHDPAYVRKLAELVPAAVPVALGSVEKDPAYAEADYVTWHAPRSSGDGGWAHVLDLAGGAALVARFGRPVVSDEPVGAHAEAIPGRRDNSPARFAAAAVVTRLAGVWPTFHYEGGLQARIPGGTELAALRAWSAGLDLLKELPEGGRFLDEKGTGAVVSVPKGRGTVGREYDRTLWVAAIEPAADASVVPKGGWTLERTRRLDGVLLAVARR